MSENTMNQLKSNFGKVLSHAQVMRDAGLCSAGEGAGYPVNIDGDVLSFPEKEQALFQPASFKGKAILKIGVDRNGKADYLPVWVFRKKPLSEGDLPEELKSHVLYRSLTEGGQRDIQRCDHLYGKTFKVSTVEVPQENKDGKEYQLRVFVLQEQAEKPKGRRKA